MDSYFQTFAVDDETKRRRKLLVLLLIVFLYKNVFQTGIDVLFVMNLPLCWGAVTVGFYTAVASGVSSIGSGVSSKLFSYWLRDAWVAVLSILLGTVWTTYKYFVTSSSMMFWGNLAILYTCTQKHSITVFSQGVQ